MDAQTIVAEARELVKIADNVVVKVPLMLEGLKAVRQLSAEGVKTNVTVTFSPLQALLAAHLVEQHVEDVPEAAGPIEG